MGKVFKLFLILGICFSFFGLANATTITYQVENISGNTWEYLYAVTNESLVSDLEGFTVYFDYLLYSDLVATGNSSFNGWSEIISDPVLDLAPGIYDAFRSPGIAATQTETDFRVIFTWLGNGTPGVQEFEVYKINPFKVLELGNTIPAPTNAVPEPTTLFLLSAGIFTLSCLRRKIR